MPRIPMMASSPPIIMRPRSGVFPVGAFLDLDVTPTTMARPRQSIPASNVEATMVTTFPEIRKVDAASMILFSPSKHRDDACDR